MTENKVLGNCFEFSIRKLTNSNISLDMVYAFLTFLLLYSTHALIIQQWAFYWKYQFEIWYNTMKRIVTNLLNGFFAMCKYLHSTEFFFVMFICIVYRLCSLSQSFQFKIPFIYLMVSHFRFSVISKHSSLSKRKRFQEKADLNARK